MSYLAVAPLVLVKVPGVGDDYRVDYHYAGSVIPKLTDEQAERFVAEGFVVELEDDPSDDDGKPSPRASKDKWDAYVVAVTADTDAPVTLEEAKATAKADLITLYG